MTLFRRKPADPELSRVKEAFRRLAAELEPAQRALLAAVPTARDIGVPLPDALRAFDAGLARVEHLMPGWRIDRMERLWRSCSDALAEARGVARRLAEEQTPLGFEALNARLGDVLSPLESFADAAGELRRLR